MITNKMVEDVRRLSERYTDKQIAQKLGWTLHRVHYIKHRYIGRKKIRTPEQVNDLFLKALQLRQEGLGWAKIGRRLKINKAAIWMRQTCLNKKLPLDVLKPPYSLRQSDTLANRPSADMFPVSTQTR